METYTTCIIFTLFTLDYLDEYIENIALAMDKLKYKIERQIVGKHSNAKREHYHIVVKISYSRTPVKHLNRQLTPLLSQLKLEHKISFYHNDDPQYDETKAFMYPLKEHQNQIQNQVLYTKHAYNISEEDFKAYTITATSIYDAALYDAQQKADKKLLLEETTESKYAFLDKELFGISNYDNNTYYAVGEFGDFKGQIIQIKLKAVCRTLLKYQKIQYLEQNKKCFKIGAIMDLAISYLYFRNLCSEDELLGYKLNL
uniref:hypothetical protein n=1 Tax=Flavobacterium sp. TaxID=239 RepID=UPI004047FBD8